MFREHEKCLFNNENNVVLNENSVEGKPCINRIKVRALSSQFSYTVIMTNMKLLAVVTPPSIYHGCSTRNTFWEENFTGKENLFLAVNMKCFGRSNVRTHTEIKGSDILVTTLDLLVFPNIASTTIFHVHSQEQIFLTCELSLPERFPSGSTIINIRWCYNC